MNILENFLKILQEKFISEAIIIQIFRQIFSFIDAILFNELLNRKDLCNYTNGLQIKLELSNLEGLLNFFYLINSKF